MEKEKSLIGAGCGTNTITFLPEKTIRDSSKWAAAAWGYNYTWVSATYFGPNIALKHLLKISVIHSDCLCVARHRFFFTWTLMKNFLLRFPFGLYTNAFVNQLALKFYFDSWPWLISATHTQVESYQRSQVSDCIQWITVRCPGCQLGWITFSINKRIGCNTRRLKSIVELFIIIKTGKHFIRRSTQLPFLKEFFQ